MQRFDEPSRGSAAARLQQTAAALDWNDDEDSQVRVRTWQPPPPIEQALPIPLVHRRDDDAMERFFALQDDDDRFEDLFEDPRDSLVWKARRPRRIAVKALGVVGLIVAALAVVGITQVNPTARAEMTQWATMGMIR